MPNLDDSLHWPLLSAGDWIQLRELSPFLEQFKELTLYFSSTTECRIFDCCLDLEDLLVDIKQKYIDKKGTFRKIMVCWIGSIMQPMQHTQN